MGRRNKTNKKDRTDAPSASADGSTQEPTGRPVLRAVITFVVLMGGYFVFDYNFFGDGKALRPYLSFIASSTADILGFIGQEAMANGTRVGARIGDRSFNVEIVHGCDAMAPMVAFAAAVLASPVLFRARLVGVLIGLPVLFIVNYVRLVTLFLIGTYWSPKLFDIAHHEVWQAAFIVIAIVFWAVWVQWATRKKPDPEVADDSG